MEIKTETTVIMTNEVGEVVVTLSRADKVDVGGNPLFFFREGLPTVTNNSEVVLHHAIQTLKDGK